MPGARDRPRSRRAEARRCALGCCQTPGRSRGRPGDGLGQVPSSGSRRRAVPPLCRGVPRSPPRGWPLARAWPWRAQTVEAGARTEPGLTASLLVPVRSPGLVPSLGAGSVSLVWWQPPARRAHTKRRPWLPSAVSSTQQRQSTRSGRSSQAIKGPIKENRNLSSARRVATISQ